MFDQMTACPYCREAMGAVPQIRGDRVPAVRRAVRRSAKDCCAFFSRRWSITFAGGYSAMQLPFPIEPIVTDLSFAFAFSVRDRVDVLWLLSEADGVVFNPRKPKACLRD